VVIKNIKNMKINELKPLDKNPFKSKGDRQIEKIAKSIEDFERMMEIRKIVIDENNQILGGNKRYFALKKLGYKEIPDAWIEKVTDLTEEQKKEFIIKDNAHWGSEWDLELLEEWKVDLEDWGVEIEDFKIEDIGSREIHKKLSDVFIVPPFSILDTRKGYWQDRKRYWLSLGIKSDLGRDPDGFIKSFKEFEKKIGNNWGRENSTFDAVLCELVYRWFCIPDGKILDPFAGGSVRGIVAVKLGYDYFGNDLSSRQIEANINNANEVLEKESKQPRWTVGDSRNIDVIAKDYQADLVFSCPPYADLEVYSDLDNDLSNMEYDEFLEAYNEIVYKTCNLLKEDRFAVFVVSDIRDKRGFYRNFVSDTIAAFKKSNLLLYNEMILVNSITTKRLTAKRAMKNRKVSKIHQNVLVFYKGNPKNIQKIYPELDFSYMDEQITSTE